MEISGSLISIRQPNQPNQPTAPTPPPGGNIENRQPPSQPSAPTGAGHFGTGALVDAFA